MKIEPVISQCITKYNVKMNSDENNLNLSNLIINFVSKSISYSLSVGEIIDENYFYDVTFNLKLSHEFKNVFLEKIINEMKKIENDDGICKVIVSCDNLCYIFNSNYYDVDASLLHIFNDYHITCQNKLITKTKDGILLSEFLF